MKRVSFPLLFVALLLLLQVAFAREMAENQNKKAARGEVAKDCIPCNAAGRCCPDFCCSFGCCSKEEYAEFLKGKSVPHN